MVDLKPKMEGMELSFNNVFKGKKVIITGNTGFKGSWFTVWLLNLGANIVGISKDIPTNPSMFSVLGLDRKIKHHFVDIRDLEAIKQIFVEESPDFVFHLAAQPIVSESYKNPIETISSNVMGTANVMESLRLVRNKCSAVIITSDKCYDNLEWTWGYRENDSLGGKDPYSASKGAAEIIVKTYFHSYFNKPDSSINIVSARAGNVVGGGDWALDRIVPDCIRAWVNILPVKLRSPNSTRPWQHVLEPLSGYLRAAQVLYETNGLLNGEPFNFGPNADYTHTVLDLLKEISKHWSFKQHHDHFFIDGLSNFHEAGLLKLNCDKALSSLLWKPVLQFSDTAKFTGLWYDRYYNYKGDSLFDLSLSQIEEYTTLARHKHLAWT